MRCFLFCGLIWGNVLRCAAQDDSVTFQLLLIGDAGEADNSMRQMLSRNLRESITPSAVVFLGDNIYPKGMPSPESKSRRASEQILLNQISLASGFGNIYFIPGNHDWRNGHHEGWRILKNQQAFLDSLKNPIIHFFPRDGCPGPEEIRLSADLVLVIIDTQWFLHPWEKPQGEKSNCESKSQADVTIALDDILNRNQGKRVVVAGHHPVFTYGQHGGVFTWKDHMFPFTELNKNFFLPLPVVGSLMPLYRKVFGDVQDVAHPLNKSLRRGLQGIMEQYPGTIYAGGHEHALQYIENNNIHYIVSGSGSKSTPVKQKEHSRFASPAIGFSRILMKKDGSAEVEFYGTDGKLFSREIPKIISTEKQKFIPRENDTLWVKTRASFQYDAGWFRQTLLGANYRAEWAKEIQLQAFDIGKENGGMKILHKGGGMETMALRLKDSLGREFNLRSVEKYPTRALPVTFRKTFIQTVKQDHVSASHPYGALVIPGLAKAAGVYHTNPKLVYAPNDPRWGIYKKDFAGQIMLLEEHPNGIGRGMTYFGNPEKIISTQKLLEHMIDNHDVQIDQQQVLRSRLFDMWIGDWDRHDDQWRWGEFDEKKIKIYRPIPRDRDQAFFVNEGFVPKSWRKRFKSPHLEGFDYQIRWAPGLMHVGRWFDRTFLNAMTDEVFKSTSHEMVKELTDEVIDSALRQWTDPIYNLHGLEIAAKLKARRAILANNAQDYYRFLAREVEVTGSNKREWFEGSWLPDGSLDLQMFKRDKDGNRGKLLYERKFKKGQTHELHLYGFGGDDVFHFSGNGPGKTKVRIIGGDGLDVVSNESRVAAPVIIYDLKGGVKMEGRKIRNRTSSDIRVNEWDRTAFEYNKFKPHNTLTYNIDDGVFIGTGFSASMQGFRKKPYQSRHVVAGSYAINTASYSFYYDGRFPQMIGNWDLEVDIDIRSPNYVSNFFGWGNESVYDQNINQRPDINVSSSIDYYRLRFRDIRGQFQLRHKIGQWGYLKVGSDFQRGGVVNPSQDRYIKEYNATLPESILDIPKSFAGITYTWGIDKRDNQNFTTRGIVFKETSRWMQGIDAPSFSYHLATFTLYQSFRLPAKVTYVFNAGAGKNVGTYQLYQAQALDGKTEIRGFHQTRFYGDTKLYFNNEVRMKLSNLRTYLFPAAIGIHAFYDVGRVWYKDASGVDPSSPTGQSDVWHKGYGGGLWLTPYYFTTVIAEVAKSNETTLFYLRLGFLF